MKKIITLGLILTFVFCLTGCGQTADTYSNLADSNSKSTVENVLIDSGINKENTKQVMNFVDDFNNMAKSYELAADFQPLPEKGVDYSSLIMDDSAKGYEYMQWLNCRLTAYSLLKGQVTTNRSGSDMDPWLMFDIEAIDTMPQLKMTKSQRADFFTLFNQVSVKGTSTLAEHEEKIKEAWQKRDIKMKTDQASLVCVYLHAPADKSRFVGHTGILANTKDGLLFFEKYSSTAPFQATYFKDRAELKKYLLSRDDLYGDETELDPIVTENGEILI